MTKVIITTALSQDNFSQYGDVIEVNDQTEHFSINDGCTERDNDLAHIDTLSNDGKTLVSIFRSTPMQQPISIKKIERHPLSSQSFMPLGNEPSLVVVAPKGSFDEDAIEVFLASSDQGVNYHAGTWHHFSLALNTVSDFLVIDRGNNAVNKTTNQENCDEVYLETAIQISIQTTKQVVGKVSQ